MVCLLQVHSLFTGTKLRPDNVVQRNVPLLRQDHQKLVKIPDDGFNFNDSGIITSSIV
jgi:hypothetical protein